MILPRKVGVFTVVRLQDADDVSESFVAILDEPAARRVLARRLTGDVARSPRGLAALRQRVDELRTARHASLSRVFDVVEAEGEVYVLEAWSDGVPLSEVLRFCQLQDRPIPIELFLYLATQLCNALEELHGRPAAQGAISHPHHPGTQHTLHLALCPAAVQVTVDGRITLGRYGLFREGPMAGAHGVEYLAPEQTRPAPKLVPATDVFALGSVLYELLTRKPLFRTDHVARTLERIRSADINTELVEVRDLLPGLEKVMFRALSANPQHRYQRAFVLREDLRGLMVGYAFGDISTVARGFLSPIARAAYEWYVSGAHPAPAPRPSQRIDGLDGLDGLPARDGAFGPGAHPSQDAVETVSARLPVPAASGVLRPWDAPDTQWFAQRPRTGQEGPAVPPCERRRPIERVADTARLPLALPVPSGGVDDLTERTFFPVPPSNRDDGHTARTVLPGLPRVASPGDPVTLSLELDDTASTAGRSAVPFDDPPTETSVGELTPSGAPPAQHPADLPPWISLGAAVEEDWTDRLPVELLDPPLPVAVGPAGDVTETARLLPDDLEPLTPSASGSERTALRVHAAEPRGQDGRAGADPDPRGAWIRVEDVPMPAPLERLPVATPATDPAEQTDPEVPYGRMADTDPAADLDASERSRTRGRQPVLPLAMVALLTALLCILLCVGPPAGVLWAAAVNGTYPHEIWGGGTPAEPSPSPSASGS